MSAPKLTMAPQELFWARLTREDRAVVAFMAEHDFSAAAYDEMVVGDSVDMAIIRHYLGRAREAVRSENA